MREVDNRYELRNPLGHGSMGQVWQAWDRRLKRAIAVKVINPERIADPGHGLTIDDIVARFRREAELGARFTHPNLPVLLDARTEGNPKDLHMVWELVLGQDLGQVLAKAGRLPLGTALDTARQTARVLDLLHSYPVIHRDVKPANIMMTEEGDIKMVDLGVAAIFGADNPRLTQVGQLLGSVAYMAPEQFHSGDVVPQTDLYALGCVLYEMLTGQPPFTGEAVTVMDGHRRTVPTAPRTLRPDLPADVSELVMDLLAKDIARRPASASVVLDRLEELLTAIPARQRSARRTNPPSGSTDTPRLPVTVRKSRALALFHDGNFGQALAFYAELAAELAMAGPGHAADAMDCRAKAAHCHRRLGNLRQALDEYLALSADLPEDTPLDRLLHIRAEIGLVQETMGHPDALETLADLYPVLAERLGPDAPRTAEVRAALNRAVLTPAGPPGPAGTGLRS
ncbi:MULTISPECIES: serine/threonine-protein kinase [Streptomyces]|uniref:non-specific serine/threonine protein kinase n=2 Tax=Streptomyces eurythermus TaxID=42237 RepID=A0ABW6YQ18_9ACTN|nr:MULTISPECIES: serine/threonine-protein kinase [Streptomyces]QIS74517.1 serine/threonine protein kinase [Streptomyces sp. DSM 40868]